MAGHRRKTPPRTDLTTPPTSSERGPQLNPPAPRCSASGLNNGGLPNTDGSSTFELALNSYYPSVSRPKRAAGCRATIGYSLLSIRDRRGLTRHRAHAEFFYRSITCPRAVAAPGECQFIVMDDPSIHFARLLHGLCRNRTREQVDDEIQQVIHSQWGIVGEDE